MPKLVMAVLVAALLPMTAPTAEAEKVRAASHFYLSPVFCWHRFPFHCFGADRDLLIDRLYRVSCAEAKYIVERRGFSQVKTLSCGGHSYKFRATRKGAVFVIRVSRRTGAFVSVKKVS